jgi:hypothetical protein
VPFGTDLTNLAPTVTHTGASYSPAGAQDFTGPVTYTVTAADGTTNAYTVTVTPAPEYSLGDTGPSGGIIFYFDPEGFTVEMVNPDENYTAHYLEAAPADMDSTLTWAASTGGSVSGTGTGIGTGRKNNALIVAEYGMPETLVPAAFACDYYTYNGKGDWFLPSKDELNKLYESRSLFSNLEIAKYWSSSHVDGYTSWCHNFSTGASYNFNKPALCYVRAIRAF